ncbi:circadian clock-controlled protein [Drosophila pseudoobscura]|uniref:Circadian clock-controlled protein n=1 Tax=Drosophila pseudoobscura pseudoobscura TaxID=46245 RepID=A0A6I8UF65_DROPS|nr:circadian clock-controlled protein [Drosophila pseudoobscura]
MQFVIVLVLIAGIIATLAVDEFPGPLERCHFGNETCYVEQAQNFFRAFKSGIPDRGVASLEPIDLGTLRVESGGHSASLQFNLLMTDAKLYNLANSVVVKSLKGFTKDFSKPLKLVLMLYMPDLEVRAKYDVNGKILILPIVSTGDIVIKLSQVQAKLRIVADPVKRGHGDGDGHTYLNITDFKTVTKVKEGNFNLSNLFSDNRELRESTLKVLNDEWDALAADIQPKINEACDRSFRAILQHLWDNIPYEKFFDSESSIIHTGKKAMKS